MDIIRISRVIQDISRQFNLRSKKIGLVPTMGALHEGHLSLVKRAKEDNDVVVVSIFVNPIQFGVNEDFSSYPRTLDADIEMLKSIETDILFLPDSFSMYPDNFCTYITVQGLSERLCGHFRPGHFKGVTTIVSKLINIIKPTNLYLGKKDYQQLLIIKRMVEDLNMDVRVVPCMTIREKDGLAMSSRNTYLKPDERVSATIIYKTLNHIIDSIKSKKISCQQVKVKMHEMLSQEPLVKEIQYAGIYDAETLDEITEYKRVNLLAIALKIGNTRLIDNMLIEI